jgi:DNA segregation ATPase FtsK/SpoIIIE, S-DNA-T family
MRLYLSVADGDQSQDVSFDVVDGATVADVAAAMTAQEDAEPLVSNGKDTRVDQEMTLTLDTGEELPPTQLLSNGRLRNGFRVKRGPVTTREPVDRGRATLIHLDEQGRPGQSFSLADGDNTIGRGSGSTIIVDHPSVSRTHFRIVAGERYELVDLQSVNGTFVNDTIIDGSTELAPAATIRAGSAVFAFSTTTDQPKPTASGSGPVMYFNRPPRTQPRYAGQSFKAPRPPDPPEPESFNWAPAMVPLLIVVVLVVTTGLKNLATVGTFALMSPLMLVGSWWQQRSNAKKKFIRALTQFRLDVTSLERAVQNEQETETLARRVQAPRTQELTMSAIDRRAELWVRGAEDADFLIVRVGEGDQPSIVTIAIPDGGGREERAAIENLPTRFGIVPDVPVEADLKLGGIGFAGSGEPGRAAVRSLMSQIAALHSPAEVVIAALLSEEEAPHWDWLKWLPHTRFPLSPLEGEHLAATPASCADLLRRLANVAEKRNHAYHDSQARFTSWVVLVVDDRARLDRPTLDALLRLGPSIGVTFVWFAASASELSRKCHSVVNVDRANPVLRFGIAGSGVMQQGIRADLLALPEADHFARGLAPIQDISARTAHELDLPPVVLLSELLGGEEILHDVSRLHARWTANAKSHRSLAAPIGQSPGEELTVDIVRQGPHGFLIGTTGSGKSELLRTLLISLAATYGPEKVNFLLIDFKGGAALKPFLELPHTIGLVTNLAEGEANAEAKLQAKVRRTIVWLRAELQRRMSILDDAGVSDIADMERKQHSATPPRLLIVADEFAVLANNKDSTSDDVIDEIVNIARLGRSLGIHLLLATQRAGGVITDNIRANTNLRIALRVQDIGESMDVVGSPAAAHISLATPGRAFVSIGAGNLTQVQTASSTGHTSALRLLPKVRAERFTFLGRTPMPQAPPSLPSAPGDNDLTRLARTIAAASAEWSVPVPDPHWAEPPAPIVPLSSIEHESDPFTVTFGLLDDPSMQRVSPARVDLRASGSVMVFGATRSGKTVLLRTAAASLAQRLEPADLRLFAFDCAGRGMEPLQALPQTAGVVSGDDTEMAYRLFRELRRTIDRRLVRFAELGVADLAEYRAAHPKGDDRHLVVVLIDGLTSFIERYSSVDAGLLIDRLGALLLDGRAAGVHFIMTANRRGGIPMAIVSAVSEQIVLRMANPDDYGMLDIKMKDIPIEPPPGRGIFGRHEFQAAIVTSAEHAALVTQAQHDRDDEALEAITLTAQGGDMQQAAIAGLGEWLVGFGWELAEVDRLRRLPAEAKRTPSYDAPLPPWEANVGLGDAHLTPGILSLVEAHAIVTGPPRSGRSTALLTIACSLRQSTPNLTSVLIGSRRSPATEHLGWTHRALTDLDAADLLNQLTEQVRSEQVTDPLLVCLDDYSDLDDGLVGTAFSTLFSACKRGAPVRFVLASEPKSLLTNWNDGAKGIRRFRTGLLLQPDVDTDGDLLAVRLPRQLWQSYPTGRGYLVQGTSSQLVQVWTPGG